VLGAQKIRKVWITTIDLIGTASNLRNAAEIIGAYNGADSSRDRKACKGDVQNDKGIVLEIRAVNLSRLFSLNLSGNDHKKPRLGTVFRIVANRTIGFHAALPTI
jgi:hypothetical protein